MTMNKNTRVFKNHHNLFIQINMSKRLPFWVRSSDTNNDNNNNQLHNKLNNKYPYVHCVHVHN